MSGLRLRRWRLIWICVFLIGPALAAAQVPAPDEWGQVHADLARPVLAPPNVSALAVLTPGNSTIETSLYRPTFHKKKMRITFVVSNNGNASQDFRLVFQTARIRQVVCESNSDDGKRNILIAGADVALSMWSHPARRPTLPLTIPIGKKKIFSCELESEVVFSPNPRILDAEAFHDTEQRQAIVDGALFGGLMALAWACLMLGVFGRHRVFLVLALTVTIIAGFEIALRGYGQFYIWPDMSAWNYRSPTILGAAGGLGLVVFGGMLGRHSKALARFRPLLASVGALYGLAIVMAVVGSLAAASKLALSLGGVFFLTMAAIGWMGKKGGEPGSKWIMVCAIVGLANSALASLGGHGYGLIAPELAELGGGLIPSPVLALGTLLAYLTVLAAWIHELNRKREKATAALMLRQADEQARLSSEVAAKTDQLTQALGYAESKQEKMTVMMGYIAHDLRAPLSTVLQYSKDEKAVMQGGIKKFTSTIQDSIRYVFTLIDELVLYVESEVTPLSIKPTPTDVNAILDMVSKSTEILAKKNRNTYRLVRKGPVPSQVLMDGKRLSQVLLNLLSNAASYCHYGLIELEISSRQHQTGNWELLFAVSDTGPGISQEDLAHIFDPFFQTRHSLSIGGLGLHVAWTIAQKMGGSLTASSELGTGSCFLFAVSVTASVPELPNERYCVTDSGADCEWMQDADFPDVPPDFCQRILELIDMGAVSEIDELLDYLYAKEMISPTLFLALKQDNAQLHFDRIAQICGGSRRRISSD